MKETKFKDTEIGKIPEEWIEKKLGDIGSLAMCKRIFQDETSNNGDVPFYKIGTFGQQADAYISKEKYEEYKRTYRFPNKGDILISAAGTIGRTVVYDGKPAYFQDSNIVWLAHNENCVANAFLYYVYQRIIWNTEDTTIARLYNNNFNNTIVCIPQSIVEQRRIASALTSVDNLISSLAKLIEKKKNIKQGAMQQLLTGKTRLKGFEGKETIFKNTEIGKIPEDWNVTPISKICKVMRGVRVTREQLTDNGKYPVYQNTSYPMGYFDKYNVAANTPFIIVGGSAGLIGLCDKNYWAADDCAYFGESDSLDKMYLYYELRHRQSEIKKFVRTASVPRLDRKVIEEFVLPLPPFSEQRAIATILTKMDDEITALEAKKAKYEAVKQGMMQQLLTGKLRLIG